MTILSIRDGRKAQQTAIPRFSITQNRIEEELLITHRLLVIVVFSSPIYRLPLSFQG
jgi:hypothetical protein